MSPQNLPANASYGLIEKSQEESHSLVPAAEILPLMVSRGGSSSNNVDPHQIVAMVAQAIGSTIRPGMDRRHESDDSLASWNDSGRVIGDSERAKNERTFPILEAFASICIWKPKAQVIAVSLQKDDIQEKMCLTVAGNGGVDPKVISHIKEIWTILKELSDQYAEERNSKPDHGKWVGWTDVSPDTPKAIGKDHKQILTRRIYTFSMSKNRKRITKWWKGLYGFAHQLGVGDSEAAAKFAELRRDFHIGVRMLGRVVPMLESSDKSEQDWILVLRSMNIATICFQPLLDHKWLCELWASECKEGNKDPFPLRRALEKLTSQHRHINTLIDFANSPRLRYAFKYIMTVRPVPASTRTVLLPASPSAWESVIRSTCHGKDFDGDFLEKESLALLSAYPKTAQECLVHCECSLIAFLETKHNDSWDNIPAFGFIGVSKLSCGSCYNWVKEFNMLGGRGYTTKETYGKYYWPWAMPDLEDPTSNARLASAFVQSMQLEYIKFHSNSGKLRPLIDSTDASSQGAIPGLDDDEEDELLRLRRGEDQ